MMQFGDIFRYRERLYVFLAPTEDSIYAGKILTPEESVILKQHCDSVLCSSLSPMEKATRRDSIIFFYVELKTPDYKDQAVHFKESAKPLIEDFDPLNKKLIPDDLKEIKKEILENSNAPQELKDLLSKISL